MFGDDVIMDVIGCLENDPNLPSPKPHRQYLKSIATFHQVLILTARLVYTDTRDYLALT
jgi:protein phosphatase-4 regulatory subunit 3